jgi:hypothetical protein
MCAPPREAVQEQSMTQPCGFFARSVIWAGTRALASPWATVRAAVPLCIAAVLLVLASAANAATPRYQSNVDTTSQWLTTQQLSDGAILYTSSAINPYFSNLAAQGWTKNATEYGSIEAWMQWYIAHLNWPDRWGLNGTIYNYTVAGTVETSTNDADSTDAYGGTFLSLAWAYWNTGSAHAQSYVQSIAYYLDVIGQSVVATQQPDGLTWAKPSYQIKYLMDNCTAYRGLQDAASLFAALGNSSKSSYYSQHAAQMQQGIFSLWLSSAGSWAVYRDSAGNELTPNFAAWYPDATSQLFPVLCGVLGTSDKRAQTVYSKFNSAWPGWPTLSFNTQDPFPWVTVAAAASQMGDKSRVNRYITTIQNNYVAAGFPWPWYCLEAGWFIRVNAFMLGHGL